MRTKQQETNDYLFGRLYLDEKLESQTEYMYTYLIRKGLIDDVIDNFCRNVPILKQDITKQFLNTLVYHQDATISVLAKYELANKGLQLGNTVYEKLYWNMNPETLFKALEEGTALPKPKENIVSMVISSIAC